VRRLSVQLPGEVRDRSYPILIGPGLLDDGATLRNWVSGREVFILTNATVAPLYLARVEAAFSDCRLGTLVLPDGESHKHLGTLDRIIGALLEQRHSRSTTLLALGGGVIGDMTGFAAACYQRGVDFI
jgi:3-dehydroquinate synthase